MSSPDILRRRALRFIACAGCLPVLTACGFRLRGNVSYVFHSIYIDGSRAPSLMNEMKIMLANVDGLQVANHPKDAEVTLEFSEVEDDKEVLSLSSGGRAREYSLTRNISFRLYDKNGEDWMPPDKIMIERTYLYDDSERLAREIQEQEIIKEIDRDTAQQLLRRMQKAQRPQ
jgi:Rare lipoprotein B